MKYLAFAVLLIGATFTSREANAQGFWYGVPGYANNDYYYGLNFGNGVGYGYGLGVGINLPPQAFYGSYTPAEIPMQYFGSDFEQEHALAMGNSYAPPRPVIRPPKKTKVTKKHETYYPGIGLVTH
jgi:hypothetical protein